MTIRYLQVPIGEYGTIKVEIEPTEMGGVSEELGVSEIQPDASVEELAFDFEEKAQKLAEVTTIIAAEVFDDISDAVYAVACGFRDCMDRSGLMRVQLNSTWPSRERQVWC